MKRRMRWRILALAWVGMTVPAWGDIGLAARFGDVILEHVQMGRTYDLREAAHVPFGVENQGDSDADIVVEFERPASTVLAKDYEAIPDPSWFKALPGKIRVGAHAMGYFDLLLTVPEDPALQGKNYQVVVKARTEGQGMLNVAIENRIRFSIGPGPKTVQEEKKKKAMQRLDFDVTPQSVYVTGVPVGKTYDVRKETKKSIRVANYSTDELAVLMSPEKWDRNFRLPEGYEPIPEPGWVRMKESTVTVHGEAIGQASLVIRVPDEPQWKGRRFALMIRTGLTSGFWLDAPVKVYLETLK